MKLRFKTFIRGKFVRFVIIDENLLKTLIGLTDKSCYNTNS